MKKIFGKTKTLHQLIVRVISESSFASSRKRSITIHSFFSLSISLYRALDIDYFMNIRSVYEGALAGFTSIFRW